MTRSDEEYLAELRKHAANARTLLSNTMKPERERMVVRAFLRCIGEEFTDEEVQAAAEEPVDVIFRSARFQLMATVGEKKRGQDWIERERRYKEAAKVSDLLTSAKRSSSAVPKGPSLNPCDRLLAIRTEDHPYE